MVDEVVAVVVMVEPDEGRLIDGQDGPARAGRLSESVGLLSESLLARDRSSIDR